MTLSFAIVWNMLLLALLLGAQVISRSLAHGIKYAVSSLDAPTGESVYEGRVRRVKNNQLEFMVLLLLVFSLANAGGGFGEVALWIPLAMVVGRTAYAVVALAGIPVLRSATWMIGTVAWAYLAFSLVADMS